MAAVRSAQEYVRVLNFERDPAGARGRAVLVRGFALPGATC